MLTETNKNEFILIIDDDIDIGNLISDILADEGYNSKYFSNANDAIDFLSKNNVSTIFLDLWFQNNQSAGFEILSMIKKIDKNIPVIMISGHGNIDIAVTAIKNGAYDFIEKPFNISKLLLTTKRSLEIYNLRKSNIETKYQYDVEAFLLGTSSEINKVKNIIKKSLLSNSRIFISSDTGCGAEYIAQYIHENSMRQHNDFVSFNCSLSNYSAVEDNLFGTNDTIGAIEKADGGTLFLEDVVNLPNDLQIKLLKFLQTNTIITKNKLEKKLDVRVISSSNNANVKLLLENKIFKEDLFYRLSVVNIVLPILSTRREDISIIVNYFLDNSEKIFGVKQKTISKDAMNVLCAYSWPGNIRQIKNVLEFAILMSPGSDCIEVEDLPKDLFNQESPKEISDFSKLVTLSLKEAREIFERNYINLQINRFSGNISQVANFIGMERSALHRKLKNLDIYRSGIDDSRKQ